MLRPWSAIPIDDAGEPLEALPMALLRLEPHPYQVLGAPYGTAEGPFRLRRGVIERLLQAQEQLQRHDPGWRLAIFDAWRPVAVQRFMVRHTVIEECGRLGLDPAPALALVQGDAEADTIAPAQRQVVEQVGRFWAPPSDDPATPPPHSTGAAVDLTLADCAGVPLAMGGAIDALDAVSEPDHYRAAAERDPRSEAATWQWRRQGLRQAMESAGFRQHPNEWWHFSHGDQLWAWRQGAALARYGRCPD